MELGLEPTQTSIEIMMRIFFLLYFHPKWYWIGTLGNSRFSIFYEFIYYYQKNISRMQSRHRAKPEMKKNIFSQSFRCRVLFINEYEHEPFQMNKHGQKHKLSYQSGAANWLLWHCQFEIQILVAVVAATAISSYDFEWRKKNHNEIIFFIALYVPIRRRWVFRVAKIATMIVIISRYGECSRVTRVSINTKCWMNTTSYSLDEIFFFSLLHTMIWFVCGTAKQESKQRRKCIAFVFWMLRS